MKRTCLLIPLVILICACNHKDNPLASLPDMGAVRANLAFACTHEAEHLPPLDTEADGLFRYGRYLQKQDGEKDFNAVARYYRIAAAHGHYKANRNLQLLVSQGLADSPDASKEAIALAAQLIGQGVPGGYYDIGHYLEAGYALKQDSEMALRYFRKAADLGSPEAQAYVGDLLAPMDKAPAIAKQMRQCATDQGYGEAASTLGIDLQVDKLYPEAVEALQKGVKAGNRLSALAMGNGFKGSPPRGDLYYLALPNDPERARRYRAILEFIRVNDGRNPKVPDIDKIVPLPPAKLPPWDGTFQWQKEQDAAVPPQKPADELIDRLAKAKNLDPATGLPLAAFGSNASLAGQPAKTAARPPLGTLARAGQRCPESGVWCAQIRAGLVADAKQSFQKGETLPLIDVYEPRALAWLDGLMGKRRYTTDVTWKLVSYGEKA